MLPGGRGGEGEGEGAWGSSGLPPPVLLFAIWVSGRVVVGGGGGGHSLPTLLSGSAVSCLVLVFKFLHGVPWS